MRLKGINPIEQNAEKVFAGIFVVAIFGVLALQFVGQPNRVKVGKNDVDLADAYVVVAEEARKTDQAIKSPNPVNLPDAKGDDAVKLIAKFNDRYNAAISPGQQLAAALDAPEVIGGGGASAGKDMTTVAAITVPPPTVPIGASFMTEVDPGEARQSPEVAAVLPPSAPFDKASITIETSFDGAALKAALSADPDGDGPVRSLPKSWWENSVQILGVVAEREMLKPDGTWAPAEPVKLMPGRLSLVGELDKLNTALQLKDATRLATDNADMVRRPPFYATRFGEPWAPPTERDARLLAEGEKAAEIARLWNKYNGLKKARDTVQKNLGGVGQPAPGPSGSGGGGGVGGGGKGGGRPGGGGGGGGGGAAPPPSGPSTGDEARRKSLTQRLAEIDREMAETAASLRALGETVADAQQAGTPGTPTDSADKKSAEAALFENPAVRLWLHDVHVERGKTYRYRVSVALNNPYFGHTAAMPADQAALAKTGVMRSEMSPWSSAIQVDPETHIFFTSAQTDDQQTRAATAKAEVFRFRWGFWRKGQVSLTPGDAVLTEIRVPDLEKVIAALPADAQNAPAGDQPGGGRGGRSPIGGGGVAAPPPTVPGSGADDKGGPVPMVTVQVADPTIMLGVSSGTGTELVLVRDAEGMVVTRVPESERQAMAYKRVVSSVERGEKELRGKPKPRQDSIPGRPQRDQPPPRDDQPGGGGSG